MTYFQTQPLDSLIVSLIFCPGESSKTNHTRVVALSILFATAHTDQGSRGERDEAGAMIDAVRGAYGFLAFRNADTRIVAIKKIFQLQATWYASNGVTTQGHESILSRSGDIMDSLPGVAYRLVGRPSTCQNLITQAWNGVPKGTEHDMNQTPLAVGRDVLLLEEGLVKVLWTCIDSWDINRISELT